MNNNAEAPLADLIQLEKGFWEAAGSSGEFYEVNFADDGIMVLPFRGGILDKAQTIKSVRSSPAWADYQINNPRLLHLSNTEITLIYEAAGKRDGGKDYEALVSSTYSQKSGSWQLVLHQQTPII